ncbi:MAG: helix-turn-helix domain-containing protein [Actinomycetes bacterium]
MTQHDPRRDRLGRRAKRFLSPTEKYELWLQLATGELSQSEAAERFGIDRSTVMRIRQVAKQGALEALAASKPGVRQAREDAELAPARGGDRPAGRGGQGAGDRADAAAGNIALGVIGGVPPRVAAATKHALLELVGQAVAEGSPCSGPAECCR